MLIEAHEAPAWLDTLGREHWEYFAPRLARTRVLTEADVSLLAAGCEQWSVYRRASALMKRSVRAKNRFGEYTVPAAHTIASKALTNYLVIMREFGVGPASRTKVRAVEAPGDDDALEQLRTRRAE